MTTSRSDEIRRLHGLAVWLARWVVKCLALLSTRGPILSFPRRSTDSTDWLVIVFTTVTILLSMFVNYVLAAGGLALVAIVVAWRIYDITCNHMYITIVDRSDVPDPANKSAVRSFVLSGLNLIELLCASFLIESYLLSARWTKCLFHDSGTSVEPYNAKSTFLNGLYNATSLSSIDPACAAQSGLAFAFAVGFTTAFSLLVLVVIARAVASIPFLDRARNQPEAKGGGK